MPDFPLQVDAIKPRIDTCRVNSNCRNCGAPPVMGGRECEYCGTPMDSKPPRPPVNLQIDGEWDVDPHGLVAAVNEAIDEGADISHWKMDVV